MTRLARDLTNTPSSVKTPQWFADQVAAAAAGRPDLRLRVRGPAELAAEGFGGILAVGGGSASGPRLVELAWRPAGARTHVVLVGKGITFDTGGISIKPRDGDEADAQGHGRRGRGRRRHARRRRAAAAGTGHRARPAGREHGQRLGVPPRRRHPPLRRHDQRGAPTPTPRAGWCSPTRWPTRSRELEPDLLVDLATLTGANAVALGKRTAALFSDNDELAAGVLAAADGGRRAGVADAAGRRLRRVPRQRHRRPATARRTQGAGSVMAALYLREFTGDAARPLGAHRHVRARPGPTATTAELSQGRHRLGRPDAAALAGRRWR